MFILLQHLLPQHLLSRLVGRLATSRKPWIKDPFIRWFVRRYQVDMREALQSDPLAYRSFNEFFTRALRDDARPIDDAANSVVSPADGAISAIGDIQGDTVFQAKGRQFSLTALLGGDPALAAPFRGGRFATVYLSPRDYHRVHMPFAGTLREMRYVPGKLFSVNQRTAEGVDALFARNERAVCVFDTVHGPMAVVLVGAMIVAGIDTVWGGQVAPGCGVPQVSRYLDVAPPVHLEKGLELGRFRLGSTAIVLFGPDMMRWDEGLAGLQSVRMGQRLGELY